MSTCMNSYNFLMDTLRFSFCLFAHSTAAITKVLNNTLIESL